MQNTSENHWQNRVRQARRKLVNEGLVDNSERGSWQLVVRPTSSVWVEKSLTKDRPDRLSGPDAVGQSLWSPLRRAQDGADIYRSMRLVQPGDYVLHLTNNKAFSGVSRVDGFARTDFVGIGGTAWAGVPCYRVPLRDYRELDPPLTRTQFTDPPEIKARLEEIRRRYINLFYDRDLDLVQGGYLTEAPPELAELLRDTYRAATGNDLLVGYATEATTNSDPPASSPPPARPLPEPYGIDDILREVFLDQATVQRIRTIWEGKKNLILQGAPGVGKSFVAKRLAYLLLGSRDAGRIETIQFHQSYSYEDFVQGYRPDGEGGFVLRDGVFFRFCGKAVLAPDRPHVFIVDEINRGNLSKILGELMLLIEPDKRGPGWASTLTYAGPDDPPFFVPENVFILGMMNTADRSLSMVDYALRRRFSFVSLEPMFASDKFRSQLADQGVPEATISTIVAQMTSLNQAIGDDKTNLGLGYRIGHSFFVPSGTFEYTEGWYRQIIETEVLPLLEEYWFDDDDKAAAWRSRLLQGAP